MGINSSVLHKKSIKSPEIKHEKPIKSSEIKHEKPIKSSEIKHEKSIKTPKTKHEKSNNRTPKTRKPYIQGPAQLSYYLDVDPVNPPDFANACFLEFDPTSLKINDNVSYNFLRSFRNKCWSYRIIWCFYPNPETYERGVLKGEFVPEDKDANNHATAAINQYNNLTQNGKLKLERIIDSACYSLSGDNFIYILFNAMDMESSTSCLYQVGMAEIGGQPLLGLLRDFSNDKILAVITLKGCESDAELAVKKMNLVSSQATD